MFRWRCKCLTHITFKGMAFCFCSNPNNYVLPICLACWVAILPVYNFCLTFFITHYLQPLLLTTRHNWHLLNCARVKLPHFAYWNACWHFCCYFDPLTFNSMGFGSWFSVYLPTLYSNNFWCLFTQAVWS